MREIPLQPLKLWIFIPSLINFPIQFNHNLKYWYIHTSNGEMKGYSEPDIIDQNT